MKIMYINTLYPPAQFGGAEKAVGLLAEAFSRHGHQVCVISLHCDSAETVEDRNGVRVYRLPLDNIYWPFDPGSEQSSVRKLRWHLKDVWNRSTASRIGRILDLERPDIVHTHTLNGISVAVWSAVKQRHIRLVHTMHDYYLLCRRAALYRDSKLCNTRCIDCKLMTMLTKRWSDKLDTIVSVSGFVLEEHRRHGYFTGVPGRVLYNIALGGPGGSPLISQSAPSLTFGFIGRICEEKGVELLLNAFRQVSSPDWKLRIAGTGSQEYTALLQQTYTDPRICWLGYSKSEEFYSSVDVVIVPSVWHDPLPYVVIEALFSGKSLICADSGGLPELASLARKAKLFPSGNSSDLALSIDEASKEPGAWRVGGFLDPAMQELFAEEVVVARHTEVYSAHLRNTGKDFLELHSKE